MCKAPPPLLGHNSFPSSVLLPLWGFCGSGSSNKSRCYLPCFRTLLNPGPARQACLVLAVSTEGCDPRLSEGVGWGVGGRWRGEGQGKGRRHWLFQQRRKDILILFWAHGDSQSQLNSTLFGSQRDAGLFRPLVACLGASWLWRDTQMEQ